ncbi:uncharacterized protein BROUX77_007177 [Berkeleyomyces rouxiae]|uniref:uncharacterized protein n=1 Tax=Berkeleyomyces rouxiae TaxID=2035830 RepID=UPI003B790FF0
MPTPLPLAGLTIEEVRRMRELLAISPAPQPAPDADRQTGTRLRWPSWDGEVSAFPRFFNHLKLRAKAHERTKELPESTCMKIFACIPSEKQPLVERWFDQGESFGWNWRVFLEHINEQFRDRDAIKKAGQKLYLMRMGASQTFVSFLQDFERQLGACEGHSWPDRAKIIPLHASLNATLQFHLTAKTLPDDDYDAWVRKVKIVAARVESLPAYKSKDPNKANTWSLKSERTSDMPREEGYHGRGNARIDNDGDTVMTGVNALVAQLTTAVNALQTQGQPQRRQSSKPPAPWRSQPEMEKARTRRACL